MRVVHVFFGVLGLLASTTFAEEITKSPVAEMNGRPHVIFISLDTARADYLGCYGNSWVETPVLDGFAASAILFEHCLSVAPTTLASHVTMFTGKFPHTHGVPRNGFYLHDDNVTLAEVLKEAGYHTAGFPAAFPLNGRFNFAQGFDHYQDEENPVRVFKSELNAEQVTQAVLDYADTQDAGEPMFLFVHYFDPHAPYDPPAPYDTMYDDVVLEQPVEAAQLQGFANENRRAEAARKLARYAGEMSYLDAQLGVLFEGLRSRGIYDNAVILITSDHGESLLDHRPHFDHGYNVYQATMHLIFMLRLPSGRLGGERVDTLVSNIDYMPTLLSFLALPVPSDVEGHAIDLCSAPLTLPQRRLFGQATKPYRVEGSHHWPNIMKRRVIREGHVTFIQTPFASTEELYDLREDVRQQRDLLEAPASSDAVERLRKALEAWSSKIDPLPSFNVREINQDVQERLEALGYLD